jgi:ASC-1-like (ASCH) protein
LVLKRMNLKANTIELCNLYKKGFYMEHKMRLFKEPFDQIKDNIKHYEYRLNDDKRNLIKIGDTIEFRMVDNEGSRIRVKVLDLLHYNNFLDMFKDTFNDYLYKYYNSPFEAAHSIKIYSKEEIDRYKCLAIRIELIND